MRVDSVKFLSVGVLLLISTLALNGAASKEAVIVKDVSFNHDGESLEVKITATDESKYTYFELNRPHRLVVDFHGIQNTIRFKEKKIETAGVERVRTSFFSDVVRTGSWRAETPMGIEPISARLQLAAWPLGYGVVRVFQQELLADS